MTDFVRSLQLIVESREGARMVARLDQLRQEIDEIHAIDEAKDVADKIEALALYVVKAGMAGEVQNAAQTTMLWAKRRVGELTSELPSSQGERTDRTFTIVGKGSPSKGEALRQAGITPQDATRYEHLAAIPADVFAEKIAQAQATSARATVAGLLQLVAADRHPTPATTPPLPPSTYRCIVVDPPWPVQKIERLEHPLQGRDLDYPTMSLDEIAALDVGRLAAEDGCHLYLWVTHKFLPAGLELVQTWGFRYQCVLTWVKNVGFTPYSWMYSTEHVLFAHRGNLPLSQLGLRLDFAAPVTGHSVKPDVFYERVQQASPGPRLDLFARRAREGFDVWGNEVGGVVSV